MRSLFLSGAVLILLFLATAHADREGDKSAPTGDAVQPFAAAPAPSSASPAPVEADLQNPKPADGDGPNTEGTAAAPGVCPTCHLLTATPAQPTLPGRNAAVIRRVDDIIGKQAADLPPAGVHQ
jgi:hypothetical protein